MRQHLEIYLLDDDPVFLAAIGSALESYLVRQPYPCQLHSFSSGETLLAAAAENRVDLLISDIDLGEESISGLSVARSIRREQPDCSIIFLTSYLEYATDIYEAQPLYFILKSQYKQRIAPAMELFFRNYELRQESIPLTSGRETAVIQIQTIIYCERVGRKTKIFCTDGEYLVAPGIDELMQSLPRRQFVIAHQGYLVNLKFVKSHLRYEALLRTGQVIPISRSRYEDFRTAFAAFLVD